MLFPKRLYESVVNSKDDAKALAKFLAEEGVEFKDNILESVRQIDLPTLDRLLEKILVSPASSAASAATHVLLWTLPEVGDKAVLERLIRFYHEAPPVPGVLEKLEHFWAVRSLLNQLFLALNLTVLPVSSLPLGS